MKKTNVFIGFMAVAVLTALSFNQTKAAVNCDFKEGLKELSAIQALSQANDGPEKIKNELSVRKKLIGQTIDCAVNEALSVQSGLKTVETNYPGLNDIKSRLVSKLDEIVGYYQTQKNLVNDLGIEGSKIFSANLKLWRSSNFVPMAELGENFIIFSKNQDILQTAQNRLNQISITLKTLNLADNQKISSILNDARKNIRLANDDNSQVQDIFKRMSWPNNASDLIISSLRYLKDAYQNFFDIGKETGNILKPATAK